MIEEIFNQVKSEHREGHTPSYSALAHDIELDEVQRVLEVSTYAEFTEKALQVL